MFSSICISTKKINDRFDFWAEWVLFWVFPWLCESNIETCFYYFYELCFIFCHGKDASHLLSLSKCAQLSCYLSPYWARVLHSFVVTFTIVHNQIGEFQTFSHGICELYLLSCLNFIFVHLYLLVLLMSPYVFYGCRDESEWWIFPFALVLCKCIQSKLVNWHVANLEIQDRSLYSNDFDLFWQS